MNSKSKNDRKILHYGGPLLGVAVVCLSGWAYVNAKPMPLTGPPLKVTQIFRLAAGQESEVITIKWRQTGSWPWWQQTELGEQRISLDWTNPSQQLEWTLPGSGTVEFAIQAHCVDVLHEAGQRGGRAKEPWQSLQISESMVLVYQRIGRPQHVWNSDRGEDYSYRAFLVPELSVDEELVTRSLVSSNCEGNLCGRFVTVYMATTPPPEVTTWIAIDGQETIAWPSQQRYCRFAVPLAESSIVTVHSQYENVVRQRLRATVTDNDKTDVLLKIP